MLLHAIFFKDGLQKGFNAIYMTMKVQIHCKYFTIFLLSYITRFMFFGFTLSPNLKLFVII
jgi:hypothetical protein